MPPIAHTVRLTSPDRYGHRAPPAPVSDFLRELPLAVRESMRMGLSGRSSSKGRQPNWLAASTDIRFVGYEGKEDTRPYFEAPSFGEAAEELYRQPELWPTKPLPEDTGFDLLGDVLSDLATEAEDSERFDQHLLKRLMRIWRGLESGLDGAYLSGHRYTDAHSPHLTAATIQAAERLYAETPAPSVSASPAISTCFG
jgi:hypothetical protein